MKIFIAGHNGLVGGAILRLIKKDIKDSECEIISANRDELDLTNQHAVSHYIKKNKPNIIILAAAKVGGINANNIFRAQFIYDNLMIQSNIIHAAYSNNVDKLLFLGSSCIYPKNCENPIKESYILSGRLEHTNEPYAISKIAGIKMCESYNHQYGTDFRSIMPTNLYGPNDNFDLQNSHVIPALIRKFHEAKIQNKQQVILWGSGEPLREFMHVDDLASAAIFIIFLKKDIYHEAIKNKISHINVGSGKEISIKDLAIKIKNITKYNGDIVFDTSMPDGTKRKLMDNSLINSLGWTPSISLDKGLKNTYEWYLRSLK